VEKEEELVPVAAFNVDVDVALSRDDPTLGS
jgi:hypothetical protein